MSALFIGYFFTTGTEFIDSGTAKNVFRIIAGALALFNIVKRRKIPPIILIGALLFLLLLMLNQNIIAGNLLFLLTLVASLKNSPKHETALAFFIPCVLVVALHLLMLAAGSLTQLVTSYDGRTRSLLGFTNANQLAIVYLSLAFTAIFLHLQFRSFSSRIALIASLLIVLPVVLQSGSRTSLFSLALVVISYPAWFLFLKVKYLRSVIRHLGSLSPIFAALITLYLAQNTNPSLNLLLSLRPYFFHEFMSQATLFDLIFGWSPADGHQVDNTFLLLVSVTGFPIFALILVYITRALMRAEPIYLPLVFMMVFSSIFESFLLRPEIPLSALFLLLVLGLNKSEKPEQAQQGGAQTHGLTQEPGPPA